MKMKQICECMALAILAAAGLVSAGESAVAVTLGFTNKAEKASAGPYTLHYGESQDGSLYLLAKGNQNIISCDGPDTSVYQKGRPWLTFTTNATGTVTNLSLTVTDGQGSPVTVFIDENADGQWDLKIDMIRKQVFEWRGDRWVPRKPNKTANQAMQADGAAAPRPDR